MNDFEEKFIKLMKFIDGALKEQNTFIEEKKNGSRLTLHYAKGGICQLYRVKLKARQLFDSCIGDDDGN